MKSIPCHSRVNHKKIKMICTEKQNLNPLQINITGKEQIIYQKKMIEKNVRKIIKRSFLMFCVLKKKKNISFLCLET